MAGDWQDQRAHVSTAARFGGALKRRWNRHVTAWPAAGFFPQFNPGHNRVVPGLLRGFGWVLLCWLALGSARGAELLARSVMLPTYLAGISQPVAVTRMAWVEKDYYQRGFLQFGVLPITVAREVVMEVWQPEALGPALEGTQGWKKAPGRGRAVELRGFSLRILLRDGQRELSAGRVRFGERGQVVLAQGVVWKEAGAATLEAEEAALQTTGPDAGRLVLHTGAGPVIRQIFGQTRLPGTVAVTSKQPSN